MGSTATFPALPVGDRLEGCRYHYMRVQERHCSMIKEVLFVIFQTIQGTKIIHSSRLIGIDLEQLVKFPGFWNNSIAAILNEASTYRGKHLPLKSLASTQICLGCQHRFDAKARAKTKGSSDSGKLPSSIMKTPRSGPHDIFSKVLFNNLWASIDF